VCMATTTAPKFVSYVRVSTDEQGKSGLGIEAQQHAIRQFIENEQGVVVREFVEIASGDDDDRPELAAALKLAKRTGSTLLVAKLDRLSRVVAKIAGLIRQGAELRVVECANASTLELHIRAVIAQEERRMIAARTVAALQAATAVAAAKRHEMRADSYNVAMPIAAKLADDGSSLRQIADTLNSQGITTSRGNAWQAQQVKRLLDTRK
jgi:DNA invertase Pin-like site-specific DNA recombinase